MRLRLLRTDRGFFLFAALTLALGIGASTAMFSVMRAVILAPVPYADPERVVGLNTRFSDTGRTTPRLSGADFIDLASASDLFESVGRYHGGELGIQLRDRAEFAGTYLVNPAFFRVFGAAPVRGRLPGEEDSGKTALVSHAFATRVFGSPDQAVGQSIRMDAVVREIIGVMPPGFTFPEKADVWMTVPSTPDNRNRTAYNYRVVAKLKQELSTAGAQSGLDAISSRLAAAEPSANQNKAFTAVALTQQLTASVRPTLLMLLAAVGLVLLIACANVAHLLVARAIARSREFAVRAALGATRSRLFSGLLQENAILGLAGGILGILLSFAGVRALVALAPTNLPRITEVRVDWAVMLFGVGLSVFSAILFGLAPAWQATRIDIQEAFRRAPGRGVTGNAGHRLRYGLVTVEIALSFALAFGAGLLGRSVLELDRVPLGFRSEGLLVTYAHVPASTMPQMKEASRFFDTLVTELRQLPGAVSAAAAMGLPAGRYGSNGSYIIEGRGMSYQSAPQAGFRLAGPGYFSTLGIPLRAGRDFDVRDHFDAPFVAIISESLARQSFPNENPIGKRVQCGLDSPNWMTIVGVVGEVRSNSPATPPGPELYMPYQQHPVYANELQIAIRTSVDPSSMQHAVATLVRQRNPSVAIRSTTMESMLSDQLAAPRFRAFLVTLFAGVALALAIAGIYASMSHLVIQRTSEMGVRSALGASPGSLIGLVIGKAAALALAGVVSGVALSIAGSRLLETLVFGLTKNDALTYAGTAVVLALATLAAAGIPALRASRIDPAIALRQD